jgi:hypothetical protein
MAWRIAVLRPLAISVAEKQTDVKHVTEVAQAVASAWNEPEPPSTLWKFDPDITTRIVTQGIRHPDIPIYVFFGPRSSTITAVITQQRRQIGIMKAIGGESSQLLMMYVALILSFGLAALAVAIPLANLAAKASGGLMAQWLNFHPAPYTGYGSVFIQEMIVALLVPLLAALWPVHSTVRVTVREAISDYGLGGTARPKEKQVSKKTLFVPLRCGFPCAMRFANGPS